MGTAADMLTPTEAAMVAHVSLRDVNRAIDERILPQGFFSLEDGRLILPEACTLIAFYFDSARRLTAEERLNTIRVVGMRLDKLSARTTGSLEDWVVTEGFLTIDLAPFVSRTRERMDRLAAARAIVVSDPLLLGGTPVVAGTRVPVHDVAASVVAGFPLEAILAAYPSLDANKVELAVIYAETNPLRGRPPVRDGLPAGAVIVTDRLVSHSN